jgi:hypothetical protein
MNVAADGIKTDNSLELTLTASGRGAWAICALGIKACIKSGKSRPVLWLNLFVVFKQWYAVTAKHGLLIPRKCSNSIFNPSPWP